MPKKAPRRTPYFFFMLDFKRKEEAKGTKFNKGLQDASVFASDTWKNLPQHEKDRYKKIADDYNKSEARNLGLPATALKRKPPPPQIQLLNTKELKKIAEKQFIQDLVEKKSMNELLEHTFHLVHVNVFCKTNDNEYFPAELAISKFSLREGVIGVFHRFLNAGTIPMGYTYTVREHCNKTHRIPLELVKANRGYLGMYQSIVNFIKDSDTGEIPCLFTMFDEPFHNCSMSAVKHSLKRIWETQNTDVEEDGEIEAEDDAYEKVFKVYSLPILFFHLKNKCASFLDDGDIGFGNTSIANIELLKDIYNYDVDLACQFHQEIDNVQFCSQSYTIRWARMIQEQCCKGMFAAEGEEEEEKNKQELDVAVKDEKSNIPKKEKEQPADSIKTEQPAGSIKTEQPAGSIKTEQPASSIKTETPDNRAIKTERDANPAIKSERDRGYENRSIKTERDREYKTERDRGYENHRIKTERDRGYDDRHHRSERNRERDSRHIKSERDRGYEDGDRRRSERDRDDRSNKSERSRDYENRAIKSERDRGYQNHNDRNERERADSTNDSRHHSFAPLKVVSTFSTKSTEIKTEKDSSQSSSARCDPRNLPDRVKTENQDELKMEQIDIPYDPLVTNEQPNYSNFRDPRRRGNDGASQSSRDPRTQNVTNNATQGPSKDPRMQNTPVPRDPRMRPVERIQPPEDLIEIHEVAIKRENSPSSSTRVKSEKSFTGSARIHDFPMPIPVKNEFPPSTSSGVRVKREKSPTPGDIPRSRRFDQAANSHDFPMPIPIKDEFQSSTLSSARVKREKSPTPVNQVPGRSRRSDQTINKDDFPLPIPIKGEFPSSNSSNVRIKREKSPTPPDNVPGRSRRSDRTNRDDFPMPIPIKDEFPPSASSSVRVKREKSPTPPDSVPGRSRRSDQSINRDDFPMPIPIKDEFPPSTSSNVRIKRERSPSLGSGPGSSQRDSRIIDGHDFPLPIPLKDEFPSSTSNVQIKRERSPSPVRSQSNNSTQRSPVSSQATSVPIKIKTEPSANESQTNTRKRVNNSAEIAANEDGKRAKPYSIKNLLEQAEQIHVKQEILDYNECPPTPRRTYDECPPTPRRTYDECPPTPRRTYDECPPTPRRGYDECPPTPRREDFPVKVENTQTDTYPRIKTEPPDTYETGLMHGVKHEECELDDDSLQPVVKTELDDQFEPMECDPQNEPMETDTIQRKSVRGGLENSAACNNVGEPLQKIKEEKVSPEDENDIVIKEDVFMTDEYID